MKTKNTTPRSRRAVFIAATIVLVLVAIRAMDALSGWFLDTSTQYYVLPAASTTLGTNSLGLRNREIGPKDGTRILFLGDSFTQGLGVREEDGFVRRSEKLLQQRFRVEHVNAGMTGFAPGNELGLYRAIRDKVQPDIVVVCLYQNDIYESGESLLLRRMKQNQQKKLVIRALYGIAPVTTNFVYRTLLQKRYHDLLMSQALTLDRTQALLEESDSAQQRQPASPPLTLNPAMFVIQNEVRKYAREMGIRDEATSEWLARNGPSLVDGRNPQEVILGLLEPEYFSQVYTLDARARPKFETMLKAIQKIKEESEQNKSAFAVVYIPSDDRYDREKFNLMREYGYSMNEEWLDGRVLSDIEIERWMSNHQTPYLSMLSPFRKSREPLTFPRDQHLNKRGHEVMASAVAQFLEGNFASRLQKRN
ncbi:MAG TPA: GDSL-type esterase/lipase family protein [Leptospiraceae bacterium]|nr:hypothetical protein [Leptospirales bacterium]HMW59116.1 GDSL-type esterase/lipase family protein [Leptospiraceae bacterium]HMX57659.1 GDSL-type esterase/lipase family protein [Leptospiraceae bacterium]HNL02312.1 GDSL-type esterase/lipase family protein [Leptospiraceae bacterium]HNL68679.1 GDSL-type esterase/lipase family protein [Leptospiraceae bacterium]